MKEKRQATQTNAPDPVLKLSLDDVPVDGALGLLAYGDIGLVAWRRKRAQVKGPNWCQKLAEEICLEEEALIAEAEGCGHGERE